MAGDVGDDADAELLKGFGYGLVPGVGGWRGTTRG